MFRILLCMIQIRLHYNYLFFVQVVFSTVDYDGRHPSSAVWIHGRGDCPSRYGCPSIASNSCCVMPLRVRYSYYLCSPSKFKGGSRKSWKKRLFNVREGSGPVKHHKVYAKLVIVKDDKRVCVV